MYSFGDRLRELRKSRGVSQEKLSILADYGRQNLSAIENGRQPASNELILRIAKALDVEYEPLFAWKVLENLTEAECRAVYEALKEKFGGG